MHLDGISYDIYEHVHRLAAWSASTAARVRRKSFNVSTGQAILAEGGFPTLLRGGVDALPAPKDLDTTHLSWRLAVIEAAEARRLQWSHGIAAKLINTYLKVSFVGLSYSNHPKVAALHPPVDRELLSGLARLDRAGRKNWIAYRDKGWSNFNAEEYEGVICSIRTFLGPLTPLWHVEKAWPGFQSAGKSELK